MTQDEGRTRVEVRHVDVGEEHAGERLDRFLTRLLATVPRSRIYRLVRRGEVRVNGRRAKPEQRLESHDRVRVPPLRVEPEPSGGSRPPPPALRERVAKAIIYEDERLLVIDKPAGIAVHGGSGLSWGIIEVLRALRPDEQLELAHRLDRDTSGCLLVARRRSSLRTLHALLREGRVEKGYLALLQGQWNLGRHRVEAPLRTDIRVSGERTVKVHPSGKEAVSEFRPVQFFAPREARAPRATLAEVALHTGRTHQIRVHAAHSGHPVAGDEKYGDPTFNEALRELGLERMFLHAHRVGFDWPDGGTFSVSAPLPPELRELIERLESNVTARGGRSGGARPRPR